MSLTTFRKMTQNRLRHWGVDRDLLTGYKRETHNNRIATGFLERAGHGPRRTFLKDHLFIYTHLPKTGSSALSDGLNLIFGGVHSLDVRMRRTHHWRALSPAKKSESQLVSVPFTFGVHWPSDRIPLHTTAAHETVGRAISGYRDQIAPPKASERDVIKGLGFGDARPEMTDRTLSTYSLYAGLYDHVVDTFKTRLDKAVTYIASRCLERLEDGATNKDLA